LKKPRAKRGRSKTVTEAAVPPRLATDVVAWIVIVIAAVLIIAALGQRCLWQDEAETAMLGRNILKFGRPIAFDGVNLVSQEVGRELDAQRLWRWSPWIQFSIAAAGMKWLGLNAFGARLPFAILGILTLPLTYLGAARAFASRAAARLAVIALAASVPFLLHVRQARWHAPSYVLAALLIIATLAMRTRWGVALFVAAGAALFYTNYFVAIAFIAALVAASIVLDRSREFLTHMAIALLATALLCVPGILFFHVLSRGAGGSAQVGAQLRIYFIQFCTFIAPLPLLIVAPLLAPRESRRPLVFLFALIVLYIAAISFAPWRMFRYLTPIFPVAAMILGATIAWLMQRSRNAGVVALTLLAATTLLHQIPFGIGEAAGTQQAEPRFLPLVGYIGELLNGVRDADCVVVDHLRKNALPGDNVVATYGDLPIMFHTGLRTGGGLAGQPLPDAPEWIVFHPFRVSDDPMKDARVIEWARHRVDLARYVEALAVADPMLSNAPDPAFHRFSDDAAARELKLLHRVR
jgi:4-amino-4-deoxy-L-arabinose transferase-like glycosyltransferase